MSQIDTFEQMLRDLPLGRALVVGDVMLDRFIQGDVSRVSAEAPIPILAHSRESAMLGGAGNVARNIAALGGAADLVSLTGDDHAAAEIRSLLVQEPSVRSHLTVDPSRPTTVKTRFSAAGQQLLRVDTELVEPAAGAGEAALVRAIADYAEAAGVIIISDYGKGVVTPGVIAACLNAAEMRGASIVVDSKARGFARYGCVDVVKPNALELSRATDLPTETDSQIEDALTKALDSCEAKAILVTRASKGLSLAVRGREIRHSSRPPPEVFDTAGAGDTALAALGLALSVKAPIELASDLALLASSLVVEKAGVATVSVQEIRESQTATQHRSLDAKIASIELMVQRAMQWRDQGLKVGFTNGCFDILHPGHVAYLNQARRWCDRLIVGLNSDSSVRAAKGEGRPVNKLEARALVLAALSSVDLVVAFDAPTPIDLIAKARPAILVKGGDYSPESVVGRDLVESWGGEVRLADFLAGHSTTDSISRMANSR